MWNRNDCSVINIFEIGATYHKSYLCIMIVILLCLYIMFKIALCQLFKQLLDDQ